MTRFGACLIGMSLVAAASVQAQERRVSPLQVGAAKVDITPKAKDLPKGYLGIHDPIFVRAVVIEHGGRKAALLTADVGGVPTEAWQKVTDIAEKELGIPRANIMITATHTHSSPFRSDDGFVAQMVDVLRKAQAKRQPGRVAYGEGVSYININRNRIHPENRRWWEGPNYEGGSDKTVAVVRFETLTGKPVAVYYNYSMHAVIAGTMDLVSGDAPGAASRYIERSLGDDAVAIWSEGAAGDQNPIFFNQTYELRDIRIKDYAKRGQDISNAMPPGGQGLDRTNPRVKLLMTEQSEMLSTLGQMLGEEVLHVMRESLDRPEAEPILSGVQKTVTCPGRNRTDSGRAGYPGSYVDADPIPIQLSMLRIGDIVIGGVNAEVFNPIQMRFKAKSPFRRTMMTTLTNGFARSGYIPHDAAYAQNTFEVVSSRLKPGCAETAIVDGLLDLVDRTDEASAR